MVRNGGIYRFIAGIQGDSGGRKFPLLYPVVVVYSMYIYTAFYYFSGEIALLSRLFKRRNAEKAYSGRFTTGAGYSNTWP